MMRKGMAAAALAFALALPAFACPRAAFADEPAEDGNAVNVTQLPDSSFIYDTSITDLSTADTYYDKQTVQVTGEVVGDRINDEMQPGNCWVTLQDDDPANPSVVSVFMTMEQAKNIDTYGSYGVTGTTLQVRGTFHLDCREHQGMSDIHVEEVSALAAGSENKPGMDPKLFGLGIVSVLAGLALLALYQSKREGTL